MARVAGPVSEGTRLGPVTAALTRRWLLALYVGSAALVTLQQAVLGRSNNFRVFRSASLNLFAGRDLYAAHPEQHFDFYKYSPTFALLFAPLAYLPFALAFLCWSLLNALLLWYALDRLLPERPATVALALVYLEVLFAMQYGQSNALVAALLILAFVALEQGRQGRAAALVGVDAFIKIFPLAGVSLALFHPRRARFALLAAAALVGLALLPLAVVPPHELATQYRSWRATEAADALQGHRGYALMQYLYMWLGADWPNWPAQLAGTTLLLLPLALGRERSRLPPPVPLLTARLPRALQPPVGARHLRDRLHRDRDLVRERADGAAPHGRHGPHAARDGGARRGHRTTLGEERDPHPLPHQRDSLPRRVARDGVAAVRHSAPKCTRRNAPLANRARTTDDVSAASSAARGVV
ncbi:MAG: hypothetical protein DMD65_01765 [Gemmatimonadetes bacterium]|nr:MAG: hypothetical protein DMD65_01765 [Gemmatimonadota bacterium]